MGRRRTRRARACCETPARVARAFEDWFSGYNEDPEDYMKRTFEEVEGYDEMIVLRDIRFESHCEHHLAPIIGKAHVGYLPSNRVVGISKLARVVEAYARRLQVQEKMNAQIANTIQNILEPKGVAVVIEAQHQCMTTRGVHKTGRHNGDLDNAGRLPQRPAHPPRVPTPSSATRPQASTASRAFRLGRVALDRP